MSRSAERLLYWAPRILAIAFAVFISLFALDVFSENHGFWDTVLALSLHLIPTAVIVAALIAAWRWEWIGATLFAFLGALYAWQVLPRHPDWALYLSSPLFVIAILFLVGSVEHAKLHPPAAK